MKESVVGTEQNIAIERKRFAPMVEEVLLQSQEVARIRSLADELLANEPFPTESFFDNAALAAHLLPSDLRARIYLFRRYGITHGIHIKGFPVDDDEVGPTPSRYSEGRVTTTPLQAVQAVHAMFSSLLGEPIAWSTQQSGNFFNDIIPIEANAAKAISSGSDNLFDLHTEDAALSPYIPDYLGLVGMRNLDRTPTIISAVNWDAFDAQAKHVLFEPRFVVGVNMAHDLNQPTTPLPILSGSYDRPYMRVNQNLQRAVTGDSVATEALEYLTEELNQNIVDVPVEAGSFFYLNNNVAAHGRRSYKPRYDGTDRWLQRLTIVSNPRDFVSITVPETRLLQPANV